MKKRLDQALVEMKHLQSRSQAEGYIKLGKVLVNGKAVTKPGHTVTHLDKIELIQKELYVSRAGLKLAGAAEKLGLDFRNKVVLDVGSSTGGFTNYALRHGAKKVIAVDVGTNQLHSSLRGDSRIELHEKTDIRSFKMAQKPDLVLIDVSFISLREVLPAVKALSKSGTQIAAMVKPQFEAGKTQINRGVVKNDKLRRQVLRNFEIWARGSFLVVSKADSEVSGAKGNQERFYLLKPRA
jgi:23S rRNA (cytidine1920-2'-O)/16S rRNA (cytidine1409-2'-O)-methyltransferase